MNQLFVYILFTLSVLWQEPLREVDLRVNGIGSGTPHAIVIKTLGKPLRSEKRAVKSSESCSHSAETHLTLSYSGLEITFLGDSRGHNLEVYSIEITSPKWAASGVNVGASAKIVVAKFGEPISKEEKLGETVFHYVTRGNLGGVNFHFRDAKLVRVAMTETLC